MCLYNQAPMGFIIDRSLTQAALSVPGRSDLGGALEDSQLSEKTSHLSVPFTDY